MQTIIIPGIPIAKKRPRFQSRDKKGRPLVDKNGQPFVRTYDPQETEEGKFYLEAKQQWREAPITSAIRLSCRFFMPIPKSTSQKKTKAMLNHEIAHTKKPDCSNLLKFIEDCLNGLVWMDDSQIAFMAVSKEYSLQPRTEISIQRIGG